MLKRLYLILVLNLAGITVFAQVNPPAKDSVLSKDDMSLIDTSLDYDALFNELSYFLDSISMPHSYTLAAISFGKGFFNYERKDDISLETAKQVVLTPTVGYYHKSGWGITSVASLVNNEKSFIYYQFAASPSYDYLSRKLATGISYTRYFTKDSLPFYTSPLQNELYAYFTYRKWWFKPMVSVSYGWGSRSAVERREVYINSLRIEANGFTRINTRESVNDFSVTASVRHDFYWLNVLGDKDHFRVAPQLSFTSGSQKFGFNQSSSTYATPRPAVNILYSSEKVFLDDKLYFQPLSLTFYLRTEYAFGKCYVQPQLILDYYFPASSNRFSSLFSLNAGVMF